MNLTTEDWDAIRAKHAAMTPAEARAWIRKVMGPPKRTLEGKERDDILLLLTMVEPYSTSNNQHSWTECYMIGDKDYHITVFPGEEEIVDLMLPEDDDEIN
jgi:hypothetical protein